MKKNFFWIVLVLCCSVIQGQITNEPPRTSKNQLKSVVPVIKMPSFDLQKIQKEDAINDGQAKPFRFGYEFDVNYGFGNSGVWEKLPNGDRVWRVTFLSSNAKTLNFIFDEYELAEGATVHLYNDDRSFHLGAYTSKMNNDNGSLGTWIADGEKITIEFYEPANVKGKSKFNIGSVVHGYRSISNFEAQQKRLNDSGPCNLDVNCSIGADFDATKDKLKKAVVLILNNGNDWCSGTLINNTNNDKAPYILTANHCGGSENNWVFRFNWISTNTVCATTENSTDNGPSNYYQTTSGATVLAKNQESDFELVQISGGLDASWDLEWAGWDRTDVIPSYVVGIHHPSGDIMKVCRDDSGVTKVRQNAGGSSPEAETWDITTAGGGWEQGVTEGGSSGSALFDQNGRIVGQLYGGGAACSGTNDNNLHDYYGRFEVSWSFGTTNSTRLSNWLDPANTGQTTLDMLSEVLSVEEEKLEEDIDMYPVPSEGTIQILNNSGATLGYEVYNIVGQKVNSGKVLLKNDTIDLSSQNNGVYFVKITNEINKASISKKLIIRK